MGGIRQSLRALSGLGRSPWLSEKVWRQFGTGKHDFSALEESPSRSPARPAVGCSLELPGFGAEASGRIKSSRTASSSVLGRVHQRGITFPGSIHSSASFTTSSHEHNTEVPSPDTSASSSRRLILAVAGLGLGLSAYYYLYALPKLRGKRQEEDASGKKSSQQYWLRPQKQEQQPVSDVHTLTNWSGTHEVQTERYFQPETIAELEKIVKTAHEKKLKIRPVGSALSPNGIALSAEGMVNMALLDKVISVDEEKRQVTVQAGARVAEVVEALRPHGLTLQNYASIREQQIGGFIQVGAHGTGASLPPVDETVVRLTLVTPARGTISLSPDSEPELFRLARLSMGALGIVAEVTLQCVPAHKLLEHTFVTDFSQVKKYHKEWLQWSQHLRYMWIPHTDAIVVVRSNPFRDGDRIPSGGSKATEDERLGALRGLYRGLAQKYDAGLKVDVGADPPQPTSWGAFLFGGRGWQQQQQPEFLIPKTQAAAAPKLSEEELCTLSFSQLRDRIIAFDPLNLDIVKRVNRAEAEFWRLSQGYRVGWSDEILGFDCGGQQWVSEVSFPVGTRAHPDLRDLSFMRQLLRLIESRRVPAHPAIEQRWTAASSSPMSPAASGSGKRGSRREPLFSWVGIIMYLPTSDPGEREAITRSFMEYRASTSQALWDKYGAFEHWAKIEIPEDEGERKKLQERLRKRFPVDDFCKAREQLDPNNILANDVIDALFPRKV